MLRQREGTQEREGEPNDQERGEGSRSRLLPDSQYRYEAEPSGRA